MLLLPAADFIFGAMTIVDGISSGSGGTEHLDMRLHRLEKKVARLRVARVATPAAFTGGGSSSSSSKKRRSSGDMETGDTTTTEESFVPKQAQASESKRLRRAEAHDRAWIADFWIELLLVLLGLNVGPLLFWYFAKRSSSSGNGSGDSADFLRTGTGFVDRNLAYLLAPTRDVRAATLRENLPPAWGAGVDRYGPLFALCASLFVTALMLWSKPAIVHGVKGMANMRAAPITHVAIAWAWMTDLAPTFRDTSSVIKTGEDLITIGQSIASWVLGPFRMLFGFIIVICFSHLFAGVAQAGALLFLLFAFSGLEKWWETGSFGVHIPDPNEGAAGAGAAGPVRGGGGGRAAASSGWDDDDDVVPMGGGPNVFSPPPNTSTAAAAVVAGGALAAKASTESAIPFVPPSEAPNGFLDAVNRGAFRANKYTGPLVLALFAAVKMMGATRMKTRAGQIFAWTASGLVGLAGAGTIALRAAQTAGPVTVQW